MMEIRSYLLQQLSNYWLQVLQAIGLMVIIQADLLYYLLVMDWMQLPVEAMMIAVHY